MNARSKRLPAPGDDSDLLVQGEWAEPGSLTPHQRLLELASILAKGLGRLGKRPRTAAPIDAPESSQTGLEAVATTRPYGTGRQPERTPEA